ncbi:hypothetical protein Q3G72_033153 [Acer saccharum]|nr:hypothetical protein Q3G72_033153 [Acer saccharum]
MDDEDPWLAPDKLYRFVFCFSLTALFFTLASFSRYHFLQGRRLSRFAVGVEGSCWVAWFEIGFYWLRLVGGSGGVVLKLFLGSISVEEVLGSEHCLGKKAWHIGPVWLCNRNFKDKAWWGKQSSIDEHECLEWLSSKKPDICFGTLAEFSSAQLMEIALGIEVSGQEFIWVVLKIGVSVGVQEMRNMEVSAKREAIEKALKEIMVGDGAEEKKKRAKGLGLRARRAVEEGGSSSSDLNALIPELSLMLQLKHSNGSAVRSTIQEWGKHLAEHYRNVTYPKVPNFVLWVFAELSIVTCGIPEVLYGLFVPQLKGNGASGLAISFLGAMVMPHNPFLHSAFGAFQEDLETRSRHQVCNSSNTTPEDQASCKDLDLNRAKTKLGKKACSNCKEKNRTWEFAPLEWDQAPLNIACR